VDDETEDGDVERFRPSVYCAPGYEGDEEDPPVRANIRKTRSMLVTNNLTNTVFCQKAGSCSI
jgi:hypothetical protein